MVMMMTMMMVVMMMTEAKSVMAVVATSLFDDNYTRSTKSDASEAKTSKANTRSPFDNNCLWRLLYDYLRLLLYDNLRLLLDINLRLLHSWVLTLLLRVILDSRLSREWRLLLGVEARLGLAV